MKKQLTEEEERGKLIQLSQGNVSFEQTTSKTFEKVRKSC